jgi:hypothetical protein
VKDGKKELEAADEYSKKAMTLKCCLCLLLIDIILAGILIWKHTKWDNKDQ